MCVCVRTGIKTDLHLNVCSRGIATWICFHKNAKTYISMEYLLPFENVSNAILLKSSCNWLFIFRHLCIPSRFYMRDNIIDHCLFNCVHRQSISHCIWYTILYSSNRCENINTIFELYTGKLEIWKTKFQSKAKWTVELNAIFAISFIKYVVS